MLQRLELTQLQIRLLEQQLDQHAQKDPSAGNEIARRLIGLYAGQLMSPESNASWLNRAQSLLVSYPTLKSPAIEVAMAQATYLENERAFRRWQKQGAPLSQLSPMNGQWQSLIEELQRVQQQLEQTYDDQLTIIQATRNSTVAMSARLGTLETRIAHTHYLLGWSRYFQGVLNLSRRADELQQANLHFRRFLQIDPEIVLLEIEADWIEFVSPFQSRALAGLAMCQLGLNHPDQSEHCFRVIREQGDRAITPDVIYQWQLNSRIYVNQYVGIEDLLGQVENDPQLDRAARVRFWKEAWLDAVSIERRAAKVARLLRTRAASGLARNLDVSSLREWVELFENDAAKQASRESDPPGSRLFDLPFVEEWIRGYLLFDASSRIRDRASQREQRLLARSHLQRAIEQADQVILPIDTVFCRFLIAQLEVLEKQPQAVEHLLQISEDFEQSDATGVSYRIQMAAQARWLAIVALAARQASAPESGLQSVRAIREIDELVRRYPTSSYVGEAQFLRLKLVNQNLSHVQAIEQLQKVSAKSSFHQAAQLEIVGHRFQQWSNALKKAEDANQEQAWQNLLEAVEAIEISRGSRIEFARARLILINAAIRRSRAKREDLDLWVREVQQIIDQDSEPESPNELQIREELSFLKFGIALRFDGFAEARKQLERIEANSPGSRFHRSAVIELATRFDAELSGRVPTRKESLQGVRLFETLVKLLGDADEQLIQSSNARVAYARLAELKGLAGDHRAASNMGQRLAELFPKRKAYRLAAAQSLTKIGDYQQALPHWRTLAAAAEPGSDNWFAAKTNYIECLYRSGRAEDARQLLLQTQALSPQLPPRWRQRINELQAMMGSKPSQSQEP